MVTKSRPSIRLSPALLADVIQEVTCNLQGQPGEARPEPQRIGAERAQDAAEPPQRNPLAARDGTCS